MRSLVRWAALALALSVALPGRPALAQPAAPGPTLDPYQAALAAAEVKAAAGHHAEAAGSLEAASLAWPQDFPLQLQRAYYLLRAGRYQAAAAGYRAALALEPGSAEARRGLDAALAGRGAPSQGWVGLYGGATGWSGQTSRSTVGLLVLTADAQLADRWNAGLVYRGFAVPGAASAGQGRGGMQAPLSVSHEGQLALGYQAPAWGLTLHGVAVSGATSTAAGVTTVGAYRGMGGALAARLRLGLDWSGSAAVVSWEDQSSLQLEATASLPLSDHLSLLAGWRGQQLDGSLAGAALAGLSWSGPWSLSLRGEYGTQRRPWDLGDRTIYGLGEELQAAARLQAGAPLGESLRAWLGADLERWRTPVAGGDPVDSTASRLTAGLVFSF